MTPKERAKKMRERRRARLLRNADARLARVSSSPATHEVSEPSPNVSGTPGKSAGLSLAERRKIRLARLNKSRTICPVPQPTLSVIPSEATAPSGHTLETVSRGLSAADKRKLRLARSRVRRTVRPAAPTVSAVGNEAKTSIASVTPNEVTAPPKSSSRAHHSLEEIPEKIVKETATTSLAKSPEEGDKSDTGDFDISPSAATTAAPAVSDPAAKVDTDTKDEGSDKLDTTEAKSDPVSAAAAAVAPPSPPARAPGRSSACPSTQSMSKLGSTAAIASWAAATVASPALMTHLLPVAVVLAVAMVQLEHARLSVSAFAQALCRTIGLFLFLFGCMHAMANHLRPQLSMGQSVSAMAGAGVVGLLAVHFTSRKQNVLRTAAVLSAQLKYCQLLATWPLAKKGAGYRWVKLQTLRAFAEAKSRGEYFDQAFAHLTKTGRVLAKAEENVVAWNAENELLPDTKAGSASKPQQTMSMRDRRMQKLRRRGVAPPAPKFSNPDPAPLRRRGVAPPAPEISNPDPVLEQQVQALAPHHATTHHATTFLNPEDVPFDASVD